MVQILSFLFMFCHLLLILFPCYLFPTHRTVLQQTRGALLKNCARHYNILYGRIETKFPIQTIKAIQPCRSDSFLLYRKLRSYTIKILSYCRAIFLKSKELLFKNAHGLRKAKMLCTSAAGGAAKPLFLLFKTDNR